MLQSEAAFPQAVGAPEDIAPASADVQQEEQLVDDMPDEPPAAPAPEDVLRTTGASPGAGPAPDEDIVAETGGVDPDALAAGDDAAPPAGEPRKAVPPDAPRTQDPPPRTGDAPPSPSEQPTRLDLPTLTVRVGRVRSSQRR